MTYDFTYLADMSFSLRHESILSVCRDLDTLRRQIITIGFYIIISVIISLLL